MGRYTYDSLKVSNAISELATACNALNNTGTDIQQGISTIQSARGIEYMELDFGAILSYPDAAIQYIDNMTDQIRAKATEIDEYNNAPWHKKLFGTVGMSLSKIGEGIGSALEGVVDGVVTLAGFGFGLFDSDFKDACSQAVKKEVVGDFFEKYVNGENSWYNKYSVYSHESTAANVFKGIGVAVPYIAVTLATAGAGGVAIGSSGATVSASTIANTAVAGVSGIGTGTETGLQSGETFDEAFVGGLKQGTINAATTFVIGAMGDKIAAKKMPTKTTSSTASTSQPALPGATTSQKALPAVSSGTKSGVTNINGKQVFTTVSGETADDFAGAVSSTVSNNADEAINATVTKNGEKFINVTPTKSTSEVIEDGVIRRMGQKAVDIKNKAGEVFQKGTNKIGQTATNAANKVKNVTSTVSNSTAGQAAKKVTKGITESISEKGKAVVNSKPMQTVISTATNHPVATITAASAVNIGSQILNQEAKSQFKSANESKSLIDNNITYLDSIGPTSSSSSAILATDGDKKDTSTDERKNTSATDDNLSKTNTSSDSNGSVNTNSTSSNDYQYRQETPNINSTGVGTNVSTNSGTTTNKVTAPEVNETITNSVTDSSTTTTPPQTDTTTKPTISTGGTNSTTQTTTPTTQTVPTTQNQNQSQPTNTSNPSISPTPPSNATNTGNSVPHSGGGYTSGGYTSNNAPITDSASVPTTPETTTQTVTDSTFTDSMDNSATSITTTIDDVINKGNSYTKIPTSSETMKSTSSKSGSGVIPIVAGLGAAAAVGIGGKVYMDRKSNRDNGNYEQGEASGISTEQWGEVDETDLDYEEVSSDDNYLDLTDDYSYQPEETEKYGARSSAELADLQQ